jgi:cytochrome c-type biogenesis protein CcsB
MYKIFNILVSPLTTAIVLLSGISSMAVATFIENDFGAKMAREIVYNAHWFEVLIVLFAINLIGNIFRYKLYKKKKLSIFVFHIAFVVMILGAGFTRYFGYEGTMHIREGQTSQIIQTENNKIVRLPVKLFLEDFEVKRYKGSGSPSSYSSYVKIIKGNDTIPFHIYMNNILKISGYRFYQASYDRDEKGTVLSVNYDSLGTTTTYVGYFLLFLGIVLSILNKNSFLRNTTTKFILISLIFFTTLLSSKNTSANSLNTTKYVTKEHSDKLNTLLIQNTKGRIETVYAFSSNLVRKLSGKDRCFGLTPVQMFIDMNINHQQWMHKPFIKVSNSQLRKIIGIDSKYASYTDFIDKSGRYKLQIAVEKAYNTPPGKQSKLDKAIIKADERMNICYSIFSGEYLKLFPVAKQEQWYNLSNAIQQTDNRNDSVFLADTISQYFKYLQEKEYKKADLILDKIDKYQKQSNTEYVLPSKSKIYVEIVYYKWNIFKKLFPYYLMIGTLFLFLLIGGIIADKEVPKWLSNIFITLIVLGFIIHLTGFIARWYIASFAPMSNGYESLIFIALITLLSGLIFSKQSKLALSSTSILAGFILMVANLSFMNPEITELVPVLKSYWLTVHVSVITGSYGFLALGFLLGIINLVLTIVQNKNNYKRIEKTIKNLTIINNRTVLLGLYFLTIGTFLGAVWANESWGRYWGWDPKETWSLISIITYTIVTHARLIPGIKGLFMFNILSIYAFASILMTYFGVNFYLSGLHSYAAGDPIPIPNFVYISIGSVVSLTIIAYYKFTLNRDMSDS